MKKEFFNNEKKIYRAVLILVVLVFILSNMLVSALSERFSLRLDTTENGLYELSDVSRRILETVERSEIYVISTESEYPLMFRKMLVSYTAASDEVTLSYIDPYTSPAFLEEMQQQGIALEENDLLVKGIFGNRKVGYTDMLTMSGDKLIGIRLEQQLTTALSYVNTREHRKVLFTTGHNERPTASLSSVFTDGGYIVETGSAEQLGDAELVVIVSPTRDFSESECSALERFLNHGGKLMVFIEPGINTLSGLFSLFESWNILMDDNVVMDARYSVSSNPLNLMPAYTTHDINRFFEDNRYFMVVPGCRAINIGTVVSDISTLPLLISSAEAYAKQGSAYRSTEREENDTVGPFKLSVISERNTLDDNGQAAKSMLMVTGSRAVCGDDLMSASSYANRDFFAQALRYMFNADNAISIPAKKLYSNPLVINAAQTGACILVFVILIPLCVLTIGVVVYTKRRKL